MSNGYPNHQIFGNTRLQAQYQYTKPQNSPHMMYHPQLSNTPLQTTNAMLAQNLGPYYAKQLEAVNRARQATAPHHHARVAASQSRLNNLTNQSGAGTLNQTTIGNGDLVMKAGKINQTSSWTVLDMGGMMINQLNSGLFSYSFLTGLYLNHNNLTSLPASISKLTNLAVLNLTGNKLTTLPPEIGLLISLKELLLFDNLLTYIPQEFGQLFQLELLGIEGNPMSEPVCSMITEKGTGAVIKYLRDSYTWPLQPAPREWIELEETSNSSSLENFTIMCYNTLCEKYASPASYKYTPSWALSWDYRKELLLRELIDYRADIICLQEIEGGQYEEFFLEQLKASDYEGIFFPKSRYRTMGEKEKIHVDGCATLYKNTKFRVLEKEHVEFQQLAMQRSDLHRAEDVLNRVMIKDNIAVLTLLEAKDTGSKILISNAHLYWDPAYSDVKVIQTALLTDEIDKFSKLWSRKHNNNNPLPVILCGDLNSLPESGPIEFLSTGNLTADHEELQEFNYSPFTDNGLKHNLNLKSAYSLCDDIEFTNFTPMFKGIIDYIWYDVSSLIPSGLLSGIDRRYASRVVGFPNPHHPSDHIPIVVNMRIKPNQVNKKLNKN